MIIERMQGWQGERGGGSMGGKRLGGGIRVQYRANKSELLFLSVAGIKISLAALPCCQIWSKSAGLGLD